MNLLLKVHKLNNEDVIATSAGKVTFTFVHGNGDRDTFTVEQGTTWLKWLENNSNEYENRNGFSINCIEHSGLDAHFDVGTLTDEITSAEYEEQHSV